MTNRHNKYEVENKLTVVEMLQGILIAVVLLALLGTVGYVESHYDREGCEVVAVYEDYAVAEDSCGYLWSWYIDGETDIAKGDKVTLFMHTSFTDGDIDDDEVRGYKVQQ